MADAERPRRNPQDARNESDQTGRAIIERVKKSLANSPKPDDSPASRRRTVGRVVDKPDVHRSPSSRPPKH